MVNFPIIHKKYTVSETYDCLAVIERISTEIAEDYLYISIIDASRESAFFTLSNNHFLFHNSFLPIVDMNIVRSSKGQLLHLRYRLQFSTQIFLLIYIGIAALLQIALLVMSLGPYNITFSVSLIPTYLSLFAVFLSYLGLRRYSLQIGEIVAQ